MEMEPSPLVTTVVAVGLWMLVRVSPHIMGAAWARPMRRAEQRAVKTAARRRDGQNVRIIFIRAVPFSSVGSSLASSLGRTVSLWQRGVNGKKKLSPRIYRAVKD